MSSRFGVGLMPDRPGEVVLVFPDDGPLTLTLTWAEALDLGSAMCALAAVAAGHVGVSAGTFRRVNGETIDRAAAATFAAIDRLTRRDPE